MKTERVLEIQEHASDFRETFNSAFRNIWFHSYIKFFPDVEFLHDCTVSLHTGIQRIKICKNMYTTSHNVERFFLINFHKKACPIHFDIPCQIIFNTADTKCKHLDRSSLLNRFTYYPKTFSHLACPYPLLPFRYAGWKTYID